MSVLIAEHLTSASESTMPMSTRHNHEAASVAPDLQATLSNKTNPDPSSTSSSESILIRRSAHWETTKRVLAQAVNEGLAIGTIETSASISLPSSLWLCSPNSGKGAIAVNGHDGAGIQIQCGISAEAYVEKDGKRAIGFVRAEDLLQPVLLRKDSATNKDATEELDPVVLCRIICSWQPELSQNGGDGGEKLIQEVQNATENQLKWLEIAATQPRLSLSSPLADWEQSVVTGHPTHPLHKTCFAQAPLKRIVPDDIPELLSPELSFLSIHRSELRVTGPFEQLLEPLLASLGVPVKPEEPEHIIIPCFTRQLPSIMSCFPRARRLQSVPDCCRAQISMRSISFKPEVKYRHHLKLSLFVQITSGLRNVKPWGAVLGPTLSPLLPNLLPPDLWMFTEPASITGAQSDFQQAGQISCVIRQLPMQLTTHPDEVLIPGAGLYQKPFNEDQTYMEILFDLDDLQKKKDWFRRYAALLFSAFMPPLVRYGLGFESHLQNVLVRVNTKRTEITGFAIRDFEGTRIHYPKFLRSGYDLSVLPEGSPNLSDTPGKPWNKVHHSIIQDNVGPILHILGLESHGGWSIAREELEKVLDPSADPDGRALWEYFTQEMMAIPRFMGMRLIGRYLESHEVDVPNFVMRQ